MAEPFLRWASTGPHKDIPRGHWQGVVLDGRETAWISCPECGEPGVLEDHEIEPSGVVAPSVVCSTEGCKFHASIQLLGWHWFVNPKGETDG